MAFVLLCKSPDRTRTGPGLVCALICMSLGKTDQKIFGHSAIFNVVRIPLERMERMGMDREKVPTFATTKGEEAEEQ